MAFVLILSFIIISIMVQYAITAAAVNNSEMAQDIKEIKELLHKQYSVNSDETIPIRQVMYTDAPIIEEECPACGVNIMSNDAICYSCGLTLILEEENEQSTKQ